MKKKQVKKLLAEWAEVNRSSADATSRLMATIRAYTDLPVTVTIDGRAVLKVITAASVDKSIRDLEQQLSRRARYLGLAAERVTECAAVGCKHERSPFCAEHTDPPEPAGVPA